MRTARFGMRMPFQNKARVKPCVLKLTLTLASVRKRRFELPRLLPRYHLKVVRLPISPPPQGLQTYYNLVNLNIPSTSFDVREDVEVWWVTPECSPQSSDAGGDCAVSEVTSSTRKNSSQAAGSPQGKNFIY